MATLEEITAKQISDELRENMDVLFDLAVKDESRISKRISLFRKEKEKGYLEIGDRIHINRVIILLSDYNSIIDLMKHQLFEYKLFATEEECEEYLKKINTLADNSKNYKRILDLMESDFNLLYKNNPVGSKEGRHIKPSFFEALDDGKEEDLIDTSKDSKGKE